MNPNNNQNFNDEALKINRELKKKLDKANAIVDNLIKYDFDLEHLEKELINGAFAELKETLS
tara:strand:- start:36 stop:221 length:186 start_codon:yes stop_codon:yes gene_type:complete